MKIFANNDYGNTAISLAKPYNAELNSFSNIEEMLINFLVLNSEIVMKNNNRLIRI
ncbi:hypothetical protein [Empedobacter falsenii]